MKSTTHLLLAAGAFSLTAAWSMKENRNVTTQSGSSYRELPAAFEPNEGQADPRVKFLARGRGYALFLDRSGAALSLGAGRSGALIRMNLEGANPWPGIEGVEPLPGKSNYYIGNDPALWRSGIAQFRKVRYSQVYPGVDLVYYGERKQLEYDFVVSPGADPNAIRLSFSGIDGMRVDGNGDLVLATAGGELRHRKPVAYQEIGGSRRIVSAQYELAEGQAVFEVGPYDAARELIIDPALVFWTYVGGDSADEIVAVTTDDSRNIYVTGKTKSTYLPKDYCSKTNCGPLPLGIDFLAFVTKLDPTGKLVRYSTFLGGSERNAYGSNHSYGTAIALSGSACITGTTAAGNFPEKYFTFQNGRKGQQDAFVACIDSLGQIVSSSYLGDALNEGGTGIAVANGAIFVAGARDYQPSPGFLVAISGKTLWFKRYLTATPAALAADAKGNTYLTGAASDILETTLGSYQPTNPGGRSAFVMKITLHGVTEYSTFLGGSLADEGHGIAVDALGNAHVIGETKSSGLGTTNDALQYNHTPGDSVDAFLAVLNPGGTAPPLYLSYLGGAGHDYGLAIGLDSKGSIYATGKTDSWDVGFPIRNGFQSQLDKLGISTPRPDAFLLKISKREPWRGGGRFLHYATYVGGNLDDEAVAIAVNPKPCAVIAGTTKSDNFQFFQPSGLQVVKDGFTDGFVSEICPPDVSLVEPDSGDSIKGGTKYRIKWTSAGDVAPNISIDLLNPAGGTLKRQIAASVPVATLWYDWQVPSAIETGTYVLRIAAGLDQTALASDIKIIQPPVFVTKPNGGEVWQAGTTQDICWGSQGGPGPTLEIDLLKDTPKVELAIGNKVPLAGLCFQWQVPTYLKTGSTYRVRIDALKAPPVTSDASFTINSPAGLQVSAPNGGESWAKGSKPTIKWTWKGDAGTHVKIELLKGGVPHIVVKEKDLIGKEVAGLSLAGSFPWTLPKTLASGTDYQIRVTTDKGLTDTSDTSFTVP